MSILCKVTINDFKRQFPRFTPVYLPLYRSKTYFENDIVYSGGKFYKCKVATTNAIPTTATDWELYNTNILNYTQDSDIENAMREAAINFNEGLFADDTTAVFVFLHLVAYYLTVDFQNAAGASTGGGLVQSKSVGSVSESYAIPQWMLANPVYGMYAQNGYGRKYLSLIQPRISGNVFVVKGATTSA